MKLEAEPFVITVAEADWVAKAVSTDAHRLHVLRLGEAGETFPLPAGR